MGEKRFIVIEEGVEREDTVIEDTITKERYNEYGVVELLNEQQSDLNYLAKFIGEFKVEKFKLKLRNLRMLEDKVLKQQDLLNEQQNQISYWKHKVNGLLWILSQFDEEKVKELLKEVEDE